MFVVDTSLIKERRVFELSVQGNSFFGVIGPEACEYFWRSRGSCRFQLTRTLMLIRQHKISRKALKKEEEKKKRRRRRATTTTTKNKTKSEKPR